MNIVPLKDVRYPLVLALLLGAGFRSGMTDCQAGGLRQLPSSAVCWSIPGEGVSLSDDLVRVTATRDRPNATLRGSIPLSCLKGAQYLEGRIRARARKVAKPRLDYLGIKFQVELEDRLTGHRLYPNVPPPRFGSFDWRELTVGVLLVGLDLPERLPLVLGLQGTTGEVEFDLSSLRFESRDDIFPVGDPQAKAVYTDRVLSLPTLRGVMLPGGRDLTEDDFVEMRRWGVKLARYQMVRQLGQDRANRDLADYDRWMDGRLDHLEQVLRWAAKYGVKIAIDVHVAPGGRNEAKEMAMFFEKTYRDHFVSLWRKIALRFRGNASVYGYDLINEPVQKMNAQFDYWTIQKDAAEAIRAVDSETPIIVESNDMDSPVAFAYLPTLPLTNVIYQCHMYFPSAYTHQGVSGAATGLAYPNAEKGWSREYLQKIMSRVRDFQLRHGARIYVGEFSAAAWATGADQYLADCISVFEDYGWDWTYHSFRGWPGWSVEHEGASIGDMKPVSDSPRKRELLKGLQKGKNK